VIPFSLKSCLSSIVREHNPLQGNILQCLKRTHFFEYQNSFFHSSSVSLKSRTQLTKEQKAAIIFPQSLKEIIVGMLLSDSTMEIRGNDARIIFKQKEKGFIELLYSHFGAAGLVGAKPTLYLNERKGKVNEAYRFHTFTHPYFTELYNSWYKLVKDNNDFQSKKKIIPTNIEELITPLVLAYWIAGDGSFHPKKAVILCTESFSKEDTQLLLDVLVKKFNLKATLNKTGKGHRIRISSTSLSQIRTLVGELIPSMFKYKIGMENS
jgi:hypothetical protein